MRPALWGLVLLAGCTCEGRGCGATESSRATDPDPSVEVAAAPAPKEREADPFDQGDRFQVYGYDLSPYGDARATWRSREMDGTEIVRRAEHGEGGDARVTATRNGEPMVAVHIVDGAAYTLRGGECRVTSHDVATVLRRLPRMLPMQRVDVPVYGLLGDGVPEASAQTVEAPPPDGGLATKGREFAYDRQIALYRAKVQGEVWLDGEDRPVRSKGRLELEPEFDEDPTATASWEFEIVPGEAVTVEPPEACARVAEQVAIMRALPRVEGHEVLVEAPNNVVYRAPGTVEQAMAVYRQALGEDGWTEERSEISEQTGTVELFRGSQRFKVIARRTDDGVTVVLGFAK
jgi:hypothetical protein